MSLLTNITVRVTANDGKFLGDDIGGAAITIRDAETRQVLAQNITSGGSGPGDLMTVALTRQDALPTDGSTGPAGFYTAALDLTAPTRVEITALGPLAARASANTASITTWVVPGRHITAGNAITLQLSGLLCQIVSPPAHTKIPAPADVTLVANVAMMCGCPIAPGGSAATWDPSNFLVEATVVQVGGSSTFLNMAWDQSANPPVAGRFVATFPQELVAWNQVYQVTIVAQQISTGNTGVDFSTFFTPVQPSE